MIKNEKGVRTFKKNISWLMVLLLSANCSKMELPKYSAGPIQEYSNVQEFKGLKIAGEPFYDEERVAQYFGADLIGANILPILLVLDNQNPTSSFLLSKDEMVFKLPGMEDSLSSSQTPVSSSGSELTMLGATTLSLPLVFIGQKVTSDEWVVRHNLVTKEFHSTTIPPGKQISGFLYYRIPKHLKGNNKASIMIKAADLASMEVHAFDFPFDLILKE